MDQFSGCLWFGMRTGAIPVNNDLLHLDDTSEMF